MYENSFQETTINANTNVIFTFQKVLICIYAIED